MGRCQTGREESNKSVRKDKIQCRHSIKSVEVIESKTHDLGVELRMHSLTVDCDTSSNEENASVVVPVTCVDVTCVDVTCSEAM